MNRSYLSSLFFAAIGMLMITACDKDESRLVLQPGDGPALQASENTLVLEREHADEEAIRFSWTPADFGYAAAVTNTLQVARKGTNFEQPRERIVTAGENSAGFTTYDFNSLLLALELPVGEASEVEVRIRARINEAVEPLYSNVVQLTVTPYAAISYLYVPGAYQGWDPATAESLVSPTSNGIYTGIIRFPEAGSEFKLTPARNWDDSYGEDEPGSIVLNGGANIKAPRAGNLEVTVNTNDNTIGYTDHSWGLIGSATPGGWDTDTDMVYDNANAVWKVTVTLNPGEFKFRKNHDWSVNFGVQDGELVEGGPDIAHTESGTYVITFDPVAKVYTMVKQ
ncbi:SusE outer membrane protein [Parapedobacter luteus]|uniref:SusE outer membrane protein n=1 Tax=Parapedobacter luteus TaxID=623280 RepID=A0A1T4ZV96_9SPHI|nr:SusE domain-containing protein [Parapedobacter luteus]SKB26608.1 SusE outer membrane protein [Parapedobacter luteus]